MTDKDDARDAVRYEAREAAALMRDLASLLTRTADGARYAIDNGRAARIAALRPAVLALLWQMESAE